MERLLQDPIVLGIVVPFVVSFVLSAVLRLALGPIMGPRYAVAAVGLAFLMTYWVVLGIPMFPPQASIQKVFYLAGLAWVVGLIIDVTRTERAMGHLLSYVFPLMALLWLGWRLITGGASAGDVTAMIVLYAAAILVFWRVAATARSADVETDSRHALSPVILVMVAALASGLIALNGASASLAQLALALSLAAGGHLLWHYIAYMRQGPPFIFGATGAFGAAGILLVLIDVMTLFVGRVSRWALLIVALVFVADVVVRRIAFEGSWARWLNPVLYGALVALPAIAAVAVATMTADPGGDY